MQLPDEARSVSNPVQAANDVGGILAAHAKLPCRQSDLPVLVRIQPSQQRCSRLAAPSLWNKRIFKPHTFVGEPVKHGSLHRWLAVAT